MYCFRYNYRICRNKRPRRLISRNNRETFQNPPNPIGFVYSPLWKITHQNPLVLCTPPFENSPIKARWFCVLPPLKNHPSEPIGFMYSPLWKITHQKPSVLCTPPLKNHSFWWALISGWAFILANTICFLSTQFYENAHGPILVAYFHVSGTMPKWIKI